MVTIMWHDIEQRSALTGVDPVSLRSARAIDALLAAGVDAGAVRRLVARYDTWAALASAPPAAIIRDGALRRHIAIAPVCPPIRRATIGAPVGRWDSAWIAPFETIHEPPVLVDLAGAVDVSTVPLVYIGGGGYVSPRALMVLDALVGLLADGGVGICVVADGVGLAVARRAVGRLPVVLCSFGDGRSSERGVLCGVRALHTTEQLVASGGGVVHLRGVEPLDVAAGRAVRSAVSVASAVIIVEPGVAHRLTGVAVDTAQVRGIASYLTGCSDSIECSALQYQHARYVPPVPEALAAAVGA